MESKETNQQHIAEEKPKNTSKNIFKAAVIGIIIILLIGGLIYYKNMAKTTPNATGSNVKVLIETNYGNITAELNRDKAPITVENFLKYTNSGFYSNTIFHRVIVGFMIQGGGMDASGREKATQAPIKLESNNGLKNLRGTLAMARTAVPDSATSQFFINTKDNEFLNYGFRDEGYAVFGKVLEGMDVVDKIEAVATDSSDKPLSNVIIKSVKVI